MTSGGVSRVTIVAPKTRIDLALPSDVAFADLLPTILRHAGRELADDPAASRGWALSQAGAPPLDPDKSPKQLEIRDGEMLYLRPSGDEFPEPIFDDVIDAVATATHNRAGRWKPSTTRTFGLVLGIISLIIGAAMVLFAGPPHLPSALVGLGVAVVLLGVATVLSRAFGDSRTGSIFGILALCYLGVSGLILLAGDRSLSELAAPHVLISATAILLGSAIAIVGIADLVSVFLGTFVTATGLCLGALSASLSARVRRRPPQPWRRWAMRPFRRCPCSRSDWLGCRFPRSPRDQNKCAPMTKLSLARGFWPCRSGQIRSWVVSLARSRRWVRAPEGRPRPREARAGGALPWSLGYS